MFESLVYHKIGNTIDELRKSIAHLMYIFQDYPNFFPYQEQTIRQMFTNTNDVKYVLCKSEKKMYKYTYNIMCQDLAHNTSWTRLPTQIILMVISRLHQIDISIISDVTGWEYVINENDGEDKTIYIGHLGEYHYVPLCKREDTHRIPKHKESKLKFYEWAVEMWTKREALMKKYGIDKNK